MAVLGAGGNGELVAVAILFKNHFLKRSDIILVSAFKVGNLIFYIYLRGVNKFNEILLVVAYIFANFFAFCIKIIC